jgi:peptidoglycan/LPS O-acetylase OafA/YrhL
MRAWLGPAGMLDCGMPSGPRRYIPTLDGWRAIAILLVVFHHDGPHRLGWLSTGWAYWHGATGVDIFFAISGLLICTLLLDEEADTGRIHLGQFYLRRAFRILPAAMTYLLVVALLCGAGVISAVHRSEWFGSLFFYRNFQINVPATWYTNHFWSLSVEEHFYFFLPGLLVLIPRRRAAVLLGLGLTALAAGTVVHHFHDFSVPFPFTDFRLGALLLPAATAVALRNDKVRRAAARLLQPLPVILLTMAAITWLHWMTFAILPFFMVALVASTVLNPGGVAGAALESAPLRFIGKRSYSLYLWQQLFMVGHFRPGLYDFALQRWPWSLACAFLCACLSYSFVEQPLIRAGRRFVTPRKQQAAPVLATE